MSMAMAVVDDACVAAEVADVVDRVFSYLFIFLIIKRRNLNRQKGWFLN